MTFPLKRLIPCLLLSERGLYKTVRFDDPRYVGDPINAVRIFNEKYVDEIMMLDINASRQGLEPDYDLIGRVAAECFMPFTYGGGIRTVDQARRIIALGVEKLSLNSIAIDRPELISDLSAELGASSVVVAIDVKRSDKGGNSVFHPGRRVALSKDPVEHARSAVAAGAGELFINSVDRDGTYSGYDLDLITAITAAVNVPVTVCGGAADLLDMRKVIDSGASAAAAGSLFVFYGDLRAVLINYPDQPAIREVFRS